MWLCKNETSSEPLIKKKINKNDPKMTQKTDRGLIIDMSDIVVFTDVQPVHMLTSQKNVF